MKRARLAFNDFYVQWRYHGLFEQPHIKKYDKHKYSRSVVFWRGTPAYWPSFAIQHIVCISSLSRLCVSEAVMASAVKFTPYMRGETGQLTADVSACQTV